MERLLAIHPMIFIYICIPYLHPRITYWKQVQLVFPDTVDEQTNMIDVHGWMDRQLQGRIVKI